MGIPANSAAISRPVRGAPLLHHAATSIHAIGSTSAGKATSQPRSLTVNGVHGRLGHHHRIGASHNARYAHWFTATRVPLSRMMNRATRWSLRSAHAFAAAVYP